MVVQHNLQAMNSNRMLGITQRTIKSSTEKLSSGYKINRAADNAAGLSISEKMRKQIRGLTQASTNAEDGISSVQTAEGALQEVHDMLQRMNELAVQSANGTNSMTDRQYIQNEIDQLVTEVDRVAETTKFNETYLLKGDSDKKAIKAYTQSYTTTYVNYKGANGASIKVHYSGSNACIIVSSTLSKGKRASGSSATAYFIKNGDDFTGYADSTNKQTTSQNVGLDKDYESYKLKSVADYTISYSTENGLTRASDTYIYDKNNGKIIRINQGDNLSEYLQNVKVDGAGTGTEFVEMKDGYEVVEKETNPQKKVTATLEEAQLYDAAGNRVSGVKLREYYDCTGTYKGGLFKKENLTLTALKTKAEVEKYVNTAYDEYAADLEFSLHVGADSSNTNKITANIASMSAVALGIDALKSISVGMVDTSGQKATDAIDVIADAIQKVSTQRSALGAIQNRLEHTIKNLDNVVENTTSAESTIRDTDMATEMVKYSNANILAQAGQSMLTQANQANQGVLSLLS